VSSSVHEAEASTPPDARGGNVANDTLLSTPVRVPVESIRESYAAFARGDLEGALGLLHDDVEWHQAQGLPHEGLYRGLDEVRKNVFEPLDRDWWSEFTARADEIVDGGDEVVVIGRYLGVAKATGRRLDVPFVHVWSLRAGKAWRFRQFLDTHGWIEALGSVESAAPSS